MRTGRPAPRGGCGWTPGGRTARASPTGWRTGPGSSELILRLWLRLVDLGLRRPAAVLLPAAAVLVLLGGLPLLRLRIRTDLNEMVPTASARVLQEIDRAFGAGRRAFLIVTVPEPGEDKLVRFARAVEAALRGSPDIEDVEYGYGEKASTILRDLALPWGPLFAPPARLPEVDRRLSPAGIDAAVRKLGAQLRLPGLSPLAALAVEDPLEMRDFIFGRFAPLRGAFRFHPASLNALAEDGRSLLVTITGRPAAEDVGGAKRAAAAIDGAVRSALAEPWAAGLEVGATGGYFFVVESEATIRRDLIGSMTSSLALVVLLCAASLRRALPVLLGSAVLVAGLVIALGVTALCVEPVDSLSLGAGAILIGLGIDFVSHLASRTLAIRAAGRPVDEAVREAVAETEPGMRFAALTTVGAFLAFLLARQAFIREMGLLSGLGILVSYALAVTAYPVLVAVVLRRSSRPVRAPRDLGLAKLTDFAIDHPRSTVGLGLLAGAAAAAAIALRPPTLETDLRNLGGARSPALEAQRRIEAAFGGATEPVAMLIEGAGEAGAVDAARKLAGPLDRLLARGEIAGWTSIAQLVPPPGDQARAIDLLRTEDGRALAAGLRGALEREGFEPDGFRSTIEGLERLDEVRSPLDARKLERLGLAKAVRSLVREDGGRGLALAVVYPRTELWRPAERAAALAAVEGAAREAGVRAGIASVYSVSAESAREVGGDFARISLVAAVVVLILVAIQFRSPGWTLVVLLPLGLGVLWMTAAFVLLGFKLSFMNLTVLPMILGTGVDSGIHVVSRHLASGRDPRRAIHSAEVGLMLAATTTMAGFGSLAMSGNGGLRSIGVLCLVGIGGSFLAACTVLPAALALLERRRRGGEKPRGAK